MVYPSARQPYVARAGSSLLISSQVAYTHIACSDFDLELASEFFTVCPLG